MLGNGNRLCGCFNPQPHRIPIRRAAGRVSWSVLVLLKLKRLCHQLFLSLADVDRVRPFGDLLYTGAVVADIPFSISGYSDTVSICQHGR